MVSFCLSFIPQTGQQADKLAAVYRLPWGTHIKHLDLSGQKLTEIPCLSMYDIESLELSHNDIQRLTPEQLRHLPLSLKQLNLSHNELEQYVDIYPYVNIEYQYGIKVADVSNNPKLSNIVPCYSRTNPHTQQLKREGTAGAAAPLHYDEVLGPQLAFQLGINLRTYGEK